MVEHHSMWHEYRASHIPNRHIVQQHILHPLFPGPTLVRLNLLTAPNQTQHQPSGARTNLRSSWPLGPRPTIPAYRGASAYRNRAVRSVFRIRSL